MANYATLKSTIEDNIKQNGVGAITGPVMQSALLAMVNSLGAGYQFMGVATPTNPGTEQTPDYKCFYIAGTPGTYIYLGGLVVNDGEVAVLKWDSGWTKEITGATTIDEVIKQTEVIGNDNLVDLSSLTEVIGYITTGNIWSTGYTDATSYVIKVAPGYKYTIKAQSASSAVYAFLKTNPSVTGSVSYAQGSSRIVIFQNDEVSEYAPADAKYLWIWKTRHISGSDPEDKTPQYIKQQLVKSLKSSILEEISICPQLTFDYIRGLNGEFSNHVNNFTSGKNISTPRFIKTSFPFSCKFSKSGVIVVIYFDENRNYVGYEAQTGVAANTFVSFPNTGFEFRYVKLMLQMSDDDAFDMAQLTMKGVFDADWDAFNIRPSDSGYHQIYAMATMTDPDSCNAETQTVQDIKEIKPDYGLIALPSTYHPDGEPTRLIIYMHGAGTHYTSGSTRFSNRHVEPEYWLAEGYAVMDMDGNPFSETLAHAFIPQAMDCYIAGIHWAFDHYNLKRDGVLLGGRSMGAGTTMDFIRSSFPFKIIAGCANLPTSFALGSQSAADKLFYATHKGFVLPDGFEFTTGPWTEEENQVLLDNWDKAVVCVPALHLTIDMPVTEEWKRGIIDSSTTARQDELERIELCKDLHMVVRCPLKMFTCNQDPNNSIDAASGLYYRMLKNAGQMTELRIFNSYMDYSGTGWTAHYYELADPALRTTVKTQFGVELSDIPMVYIEMLQFWRRYEQL